MSLIPPSEKLVETKTCRLCSGKFPITDKDLEFYEKISPVFGGKKYAIPTPTLCSDCRHQRRLSFRNERKLYKRTCDATGKDIIAMYSPLVKTPVYSAESWWSDKWDPLKYGQDFDFSKTFFEQFHSLSQKVPVSALITSWCENSAYTNYTDWMKDSYLTFGWAYSQNDMYGTFDISSHDNLEFYWIKQCSDCYEVTECTDCFKTTYSNMCQQCSDCHLCSDCVGCKNCIGCVGLRNKDFHVFNKPVSPQEFERINKECKIIDGRKKLFKEMRWVLGLSPVLAAKIFMSQNCTGDRITKSKNCTNVFSVDDSEDCNDFFLWFGLQNVRSSCIWGYNIHYEYDSMGIVQGSFILFSSICWGGGGSDHLTYCQYCYNNSSHLFGCIGLRSKQYCILNKQYTKKQYEALVPRIIEHMKKSGEWGEFFPSSLSPFGYNETVASEYFSLTKAEAKKKGFNWSDYEAPFPKVEKIIPASKLPDDITKIPDDILNWAIECEVTGKPFRIIKQELEFYRKHNLPIPRKHPDQRHMDRVALRNPRKLFERKCDKCKTDILTTYAPERPEIVYCEACYMKEVIG